MAIKLIVGLGNFGTQYELHRHNAGFWFIEKMVSSYANNFKKETKFCVEIAKITINKQCVIVIKPSTYINCCGQAIKNIIDFYKININDILIVHDDLDLETGVAKLKFNGGHGGHNGIKDIMNVLGTNDFYRLRIGISRPPDKSMITNFVLNAPNEAEFELIQNSLTKSLSIITNIISGDFAKAMNKLHAQ